MADEFVPYIPADKTDVKEITVKAVIIGLILSVIMAAATTYFGLYVGMTVSAAIPAAVISTAILKPFKGTVLEVAVVTTFAAAGEALSAGVIFTIPALLILYTATGGAAGWAGLGGTANILVVLFVAFIGGILGVLFTIPLRRIFIVDLNLKYPEGVACGEVIKAGEQGGSGIKYIIISLGMGILFKLFSSKFAFNVFKERFMLALPEALPVKLGGGGNPNFKLPFGLNVSPALAAVGYIIGIRASLMVATGGLIGWMILIPIVGFFIGWGTHETFTDSGVFIANTGEQAIFYVWREATMYVGIGAIVVGGVSTLWKMRKNMVVGVKKSIAASSADAAAQAIRTDLDFPFKKIFFVILPVGMAIFYFLFIVLGGMLNPITAVFIAVLLASLLFIFAFLFTAVAGYIAGVLGSSNNPISGVTVTTLLFTALILYGLSWILIGLSTNVGMTATIVVAGIVCCSAAIAGDCMQNMKVGTILGSTPRRLQIAEFGGVTITALCIPFILLFLHQVYEIGNPETLPAPQAYVMAGVVQSVMTINIVDILLLRDVKWIMLGIGVIFAVGLLLLEKLKIARISIMAVAIGIYLPITLSIPILIGGIVSHFSKNYITKKMKAKWGGSEDYEEMHQREQEESESRGVLFCSGLIAGEALCGVLIAVIVLVAGTGAIALIDEPSMWPGLAIFAYIVGLLGYLVVRGVVNQQKSD